MADMTPDSVREKQNRLAAFMNMPDPFEGRLGLGAQPMKPKAPDAPVDQAPPMSRQQQDWLDLYEQMDPAMRTLLSRKTPETLAILKWQAGLLKNKAMPLVLSLPMKVTFSVSVLAFTPVGEFRVFVLPAEAAEIQMEMGASLSFRYDGKTCDAVFVSCYRLEGLPYKFLQLGVDQAASKE